MAKSTNREDHLKALYALGERKGGPDAWVATNDLAAHLQVKPPSVSGMVQVLQELGWAEHRPYHGARLTPTGRSLALSLVRKHRLWETFLVKRLGFGWDQVHDIAEQLEHIDSVELVQRLDAYLDHPEVDPHGEPIPNAHGDILDKRVLMPLSELPADTWGQISAVQDDQGQVLDQLQRHNLALGSVIGPKERMSLPSEGHQYILVTPWEEMGTQLQTSAT
tara:strand:- start:16498 stop:17160 length:663 start_codon:yes stop_codon:yes gene_type:complete